MTGTSLCVVVCVIVCLCAYQCAVYIYVCLLVNIMFVLVCANYYCWLLCKRCVIMCLLVSHISCVIYQC